MTQEDVLIRATVGDARVYAVTTTHLTQYMNKIHGLSPVAAAALGRACRKGPHVPRVRALCPLPRP